jgi:hypothetical protein
VRAAVALTSTAADTNNITRFQDFERGQHVGQDSEQIFDVRRASLKDPEADRWSDP